MCSCWLTKAKSLNKGVTDVYIKAYQPLAYRRNRELVDYKTMVSIKAAKALLAKPDAPRKNSVQQTGFLSQIGVFCFVGVHNLLYFL